jgi:hypothetical protein
MKKIIFLVLSLALALILFISCTGTTEDNPVNGADGESPGEVIMSDWYFFRSHDGQDNPNLLRTNSLSGKGPVKINPVTQTVTFVCLDPLCSHETECPLFGAGNFRVSGNYLFFAQTETDFDEATGSWLTVRELIAYNMKSGAARQLAKYGDFIHMLDAAGNYLYYQVAVYDEDDRRRESPAYTIYRADARTGSIITIGEYLSANTAIIPRIYTITGDKIYWHEPDEAERFVFYMTDLAGNNRENIYLESDAEDLMTMLTNPGGGYSDGYAYYLHMVFTVDIEEYMLLPRELLELGRNWHLYRIPFPGGGESELVIESLLSDYLIHGGKIYYKTMQKDADFIESSGQRIYNWGGGKVYAANTDGTESRLVADLGSGYDISFLGAKTIDGVDYLALSFGIINDDPQQLGNFRISPDTIIINASTGEWAVLSMPE